jgi:hypothetical protein
VRSPLYVIRQILLFTLLVATLGMALGCTKKKPDTASATPPQESNSPSPTPAGPALALNNIFRIVSTGESLSYNSLTGGPHAIAIHPITKLPAIAYYDKTANISGTTAVGALKYASMDTSGSWTIEVVDSNYGTAVCGSAGSYCVGAPNVASTNYPQIMDLAFRPDGVAAIAYVYGASSSTSGGSKQIRYAEKLSQSGWKVVTAFSSSVAAAATNVSISATVDPLKAVNLAFDSNQRAHITFAFYAQTLTNSRVKYVSVGSDSIVSAVVDIANALSGSGTITAALQGENQGGLAYCPSAGPIVSGHTTTGAAGIGNPFYARCTALAANGACTSFSSIALTNGCSGSACFSSGITSSSNAGQRTSLVLDPNNKPVLGVYSVATPATSLLTAVLPAACGTSPSSTAGSWGAMQTVGSTQEGVNGFSLAVSATQLFAAYTKSTTTVQINACTLGSCTWLTPAATVETTTVNNEGVGLKYEPSSDQLYMSYARLPSAASNSYGNDIVFASGAPSDIVSAGNLIFNLSVIDNLMGAFPSSSTPTISAAKSSNGTVGFAYFYQDATAADSKLYYGVRGGPISAPVFGANFVTSHQESAAASFVGAMPSLAYDSNNNPVIAYYNGVDKSLQVARSSNGGVSFSITTVDDHASNNLGQYPSSAASGSSLAVAYYDVTNTGLKFARYASGSWKISAVDGMAGTGSCGNASNDAGKYAKLSFTSTGRPVIAYQMDNNLRLAIAAESVTSNTFTWSCATLDASGNTRGVGIDMALSSNDIPSIVHFDSTAGRIYYLTCSSNVSNCIANSNLFSAELVDAVGTTASVTTKPSIQINSSGKIFISYYSAVYQGMGLASRSSGDSSFAKEYIDTIPSSGVQFISPAGQYGSMLLNDAGYPTIFYRSMENFIKYFSRELI